VRVECGVMRAARVLRQSSEARRGAFMCRRRGGSSLVRPAREGANVVGEVVGSIRVALAGHQISEVP
jgi:hypothetical protein